MAGGFQLLVGNRRSSNSRRCGVNQRLDFLRKTPPVRAEFVEQNRTEHYVAVLATLI
jgi:hypothetical protein